MITFSRSYRKGGEWKSESLSADEARSALKAQDSFAAFGTQSDLVTLRTALLSKGIVCGEAVETSKAGRYRLAINPPGVSAEAFAAMLG